MFTVLDIETTGLSQYTSKIIEIYAHSFGKSDTEFHSLINPERSVPRSITRLTGISNPMVISKPTIKTVMPKFNSFLSKSDVIVGHNISFDLRFLNHFSKMILNEPIANETLCTLKVGRRFFHDTNKLTNFKLNTMCNYFGIDMNGHHRAKCDTLATKELFLCLKEQFEDKGLSISDMKELQSVPCSKANRIIHEK